MRNLQQVLRGEDYYLIDVANIQDSITLDDFLQTLSKCPDERAEVVANLLNLGDKDSLTLAYELSKA